MSAFCGLFHRDGRPIDLAGLDRSLTELAPYGLDASGAWGAGPAALGYQATYVTPESVGVVQPYRVPDSPLVVVYDGRLDNRDELSVALGVTPGERTTVPDVALVLCGYARWGADLPERLLGDFALAIWDAREQRLFCARDVMGVKPFYYYETPGTFAFATDLAGLLALPDVPWRLDVSFIRATFEGMPHHPERTAYAGVRALPPATSLMVDARQCRRRRYWEPTSDRPVRLGSDASYAAALRELLETAVHDRLRSAYPVGTHISAGLDSTPIAVLAARHRARGGPPVTAFTYAPPPGTPLPALDLEGKYTLIDDQGAVAGICATEGLPLVYASLTSEALADHWLNDITTRPRMNGLPREWQIARQAADRGIRLMLSGWGGDEAVTFNGRGYLDSLIQRRALLSLLRELWGLARTYDDIRFWRPAAGHVVRWLLGERLWHRLRPKKEESPGQSLSPYLHPDFTAALRAAPPLAWPERERPPSVRGHMRDLLTYGHVAFRMEGWAVNGRHGLSYSYPLLDRRLLDFCLNIPESLFLREGWRRWLIRQATAGILPEVVRWNRYKLDAAVMAATPDHDPAMDAEIRLRLRADYDRIRAAGMLDVDAVLAAELVPVEVVWLAMVRA